MTHVHPEQLHPLSLSKLYHLKKLNFFGFIYSSSSNRLECIDLRLTWQESSKSSAPAAAAEAWSRPACWKAKGEVLAARKGWLRKVASERAAW